MAKKKKEETKVVRKSALSPGVKTALGAIAGGAVGALGGALITRAGMNPKTAAWGLLIGGGVGALAMTGAARAAAGGIAAAGGGQVAIAWLAHKTAAAPAAPQVAQAPQLAPPAGNARGVSEADMRRAFDDVRREMDPDPVYDGNNN